MYSIKKQCNSLYGSSSEDQLKKINNTSFTFPEVIVRDASKIFDIGTGQYDEFVRSRFFCCCQHTHPKEWSQATEGCW